MFFDVKRIYGLCFSLCAGAALAQELPNAVSQVPDLPALGHAFGAAAYAATPENLAASGYQEQEFLFSGTAQVYAYTATSDTAQAVASGPYTNRMLIRRPTDPQRFSGNVVFEVINGALNFDGVTGWTLMSRQIVRHGDIWVGISSSPFSIAALKNFNPQRYASLSFANPQQHTSSQACNAGADEQGLVYDMFTQVAGLLRQPDSALNPLHGLAVKRVYAWGYSQGALILTTYLNAIAPGLAQEPFDGYMVAAGLGGYSLSNCSSLLESDGHQPVPSSQRAAVFQIQTTSETALLPIGFPAKPDSDAADDRYRLYEIAGSGHLDEVLLNGVSNDADLQAAGNFDVANAIAGCKLSEPLDGFPAPYVYDNLLAKMEDWVERGIAPPHAPALFLGGAQSTPIGGLRSPAVDVPTTDFNFGHNGSLLTVLDNTVAPVLVPCFLTLTQPSFPAWQLALLYPSHAAYVQKVSASASQLQQQGFLTDYDAAQIIEDAKAATLP